MENRRRLVWLGALALILAVPPVASSVVGDLGTASVQSEQRQNQRLDRHTKRLNRHGTQLKRLGRAEYGVARVITTASGSVFYRTLTTSAIPSGGNQAMTSATLPFNSKGGEVLRLRGVVRSSIHRGSEGPSPRAAGVLWVVCAPIGTDSCDGGSVSAGQTVCALTSNYNTGTGVLTFRDVRETSLGDGSAPTVGDTDIAGGFCTLPAGGGVYTVTATAWYLDPILG
jgi:hypothetical protein